MSWKLDHCRSRNNYHIVYLISFLHTLLIITKWFPFKSKYPLVALSESEDLARVRSDTKHDVLHINEYQPLPFTMPARLYEFVCQGYSFILLACKFFALNYVHKVASTDVQCFYLLSSQRNNFGFFVLRI